MASCGIMRHDCQPEAFMIANQKLSVSNYQWLLGHRTLITFHSTSTQLSTREEQRDKAKWEVVATNARRKIPVLQASALPRPRVSSGPPAATFISPNSMKGARFYTSL